MTEYTVIWVDIETRRKLKKVAVDSEISMRELATIIIEQWIKEKKEHEHNVITKPPDADQTRRKPDA
jgi:hypothetical protein